MQYVGPANPKKTQERCYVSRIVLFFLTSITTEESFETFQKITSTRVQGRFVYYYVKQITYFTSKDLGFVKEFAVKMLMNPSSKLSNLLVPYQILILLSFN